MKELLCYPHFIDEELYAERDKRTSQSPTPWSGEGWLVDTKTVGVSHDTVLPWLLV